MPAHPFGCPCRFCAGLMAKTMTEPEWDAAHAGHGAPTREPFTYEDGAATRTHVGMYWRACPCGAKLLCTVAGEA